MITTAILNIVNWFSLTVINLLPDVSLSDSLLTAITTANGYLSAMSIVLPVGTLVIILGLFLTIEFVIFSIKVVNWFIRKVPMIN